jgi:hypothetical protein
MAALLTNIADGDDIPSDLKELDESLRCNVCREYYFAAVTISEDQCGHSFCSECIRNCFRHQMMSVHRTTRCPKCNLAVREKAVVQNRALQEAVLAYQNTLSQRKRQEAAKKQSPMATPSPAHRPVRASRRNKTQAELPANKATEEASTSAGIDPSVSKMDSSDCQLLEAPRRKKPIANYGNKNRKKLREMVCTPTEFSLWFRTSLSSLVALFKNSLFSSFSREFQCEKEGLSTDGSEQELKERHVAFITLFNAETDSINPRSEVELRLVIRNREKQRRQETLRSSEKSDHVALQAILQNGGQTSGKTGFDIKFKSGFSNMIAQMKARKQKESSSKQDDDQENKTESVDGVVTDSANQSVAPIDLPISDVEGSSQQSSNPPQDEEVGREALVHTSRTVYLDTNGQDSSSSNHRQMEGSNSSPPRIEQHSPVVDLLNEEESSSSNNRPAGPPSFSSRRRESPAKESASSAPPKRQKRSIIQPWNCSKCTFLNEKNINLYAKCELCGENRPKTGLV